MSGTPWDHIDPWDRNQVREKRDEIWEGTYVTNRARAQAGARGLGDPGMWKCRGCSRTFADEWAWYCHVSAEEKATSVSKKRPWSLLCLGPSVAKVSEWEWEREEREQQRDRWGEQLREIRDQREKGKGGKGKPRSRNPGSRSRTRSRSRSRLPKRNPGSNIPERREHPAVREAREGNWERGGSSASRQHRDRA